MWAKLNFCAALVMTCAIAYIAAPRPVPQSADPLPIVPQSVGGMGSFVQALSAGADKGGYIANYSFPSDHYRTGWAARNAIYTEDGLRLSIDRRPTRFQPFSGAEYHRRGKFGFGRYEVIMKAAHGEGVVSAFFLYTGPHYGDPHNEIDLEFLGRDTTVLHPNLYVDGKAFSPPSLQLGFDAADDFNLYAFEWAPERVTWFVNNEPVLDLNRPAHAMPTHPGIIMANIWTGAPGLYAWHGEPNFADGTHAVFRCISFQALGEETEQCSDLDDNSSQDMRGSY